MFMTKTTKSIRTLPEDAEVALMRLGENLRIAREWRRESLRVWASRMDVLVSTLQRMERGDPTVGVGIYATAIWLAGQIEALGNVVMPAVDDEVLEMELHRSRRRRSPLHQRSRY